MDIILNELSIVPASRGQSDEERFQTLVSLLKELCRIGARRTVRCTRDCLERMVADDVTLREWLCRRDRIFEEKRFLRSLLSKTPFVDEIILNSEPSDVALEFRWKSHLFLGGGLAHLRHWPLISLPHTEEFSQGAITVTLTKCLPSGDTSEATIEIENFALLIHVELRRSSLRERVFRDITDGHALWLSRDRTLPNLVFCHETERAMCALSGNEPFFRAVCHHLCTINDAVGSWKDGELRLDLDWSYESKATLRHARYGHRRKILCPDGQERQFSAHSKIKSHNKRIYFLPDLNNKRAFIGYIGGHLPTVKHHD